MSAKPTAPINKNHILSTTIKHLQTKLTIDSCLNYLFVELYLFTPSNVNTVYLLNYTSSKIFNHFYDYDALPITKKLEAILFFFRVNIVPSSAQRKLISVCCFSSLVYYNLKGGEGNKETQEWPPLHLKRKLNRFIFPFFFLLDFSFS